MRRWILIGILALVVIGGGAWWVQRDDPGAPPAVDAENFEPEVATALLTARGAIQEDRRSAAAWGEYGMALDAHDRLAAAAVCYEIAARLDPNDFRWPYMLALCLPDEQPERVIELLERARRLRPDHAPIHLRLGRYYLMTPDGQSAAAERFTEALRLAPDSSHARWGLARLAYDAGDLKEARHLLEEAAQRAPAHREVHALLARVLAQLGEPAAAAVAQRAAEQLTGRFPIRDTARTEVLARRAGSARLFEEATRAVAAGRTDIAADRFRRAEASLRAMRQRYPDDLALRRRLGRSLVQHAWMLATHADPAARDGAQALTLAEELNALFPNEAQPLEILAAALAEAGRFAEAVKALEKAIELVGNNPGFVQSARARLALYRAGKVWYQPR